MSYFDVIIVVVGIDTSKHIYSLINSTNLSQRVILQKHFLLDNRSIKYHILI